MGSLVLLSLMLATILAGYVYGVTIDRAMHEEKLNMSIPFAGRAGQARTTACRWSTDVTKCAETAVAHFDGKSWCTFHLCGPSYVRAAECPEGELQATHKCLVEQEKRTAWICEGVTVIKGLGLPLNCRGNCDSHVDVCTCSRIEKHYEKLTKIVRARAICNPGRD